MTAKEFVLDYALNHEDNINKKTGKSKYKSISDLFEDIGYEYIHSFDYDARRHWTDFSAVVEINKRLIMYHWATCDGDMSIWDKGFEFDEDSIEFVEKVPVITTTYEYKVIK